jgi:NAD(P)-dependent dehydrogenase (short-subunit alcohol dehydrogenase family)
MTVDMPLADKIALVTGASRGIGRASALALAGAGAHVVATARTQGALESLDDEIFALTGRHATLVPLDLAEPAGLDALGLALHQRFGRLDISVHAGAVLGAITPVSHVEPGLWDRVMTVNATASWRLIRSMEPLLKASEAGRALFVTSSRAASPRAFWGPYGASKAAMEAIVRAWADELEHTGVRAAIVDPGAMRTRMRAEAYPGEDPADLPDPSEIGPMMIELVLSDPGLPTAVRTFRAWKAGRVALSPST